MPLFDAAREFWSRLKIDFVSGKNGNLSPFLTELSKKYANGKVQYGHFKVRTNYYDKDFSKELMFLYNLKERLLRFEEICNYFSNYSIDPEVDFTKVIEDLSPYDLPGCLANILHNGGAYSLPNSNMGDYYTGLNAALELTEGNLNNGLIWFSGVAWSDYFLDVAWDKTIIVYKPKTDNLEIIFATDTD